MRTMHKSGYDCGMLKNTALIIACGGLGFVGGMTAQKLDGNPEPVIHECAADEAMANIAVLKSMAKHVDGEIAISAKSHDFYDSKLGAMASEIDSIKSAVDRTRREMSSLELAVSSLRFR